MNLIAAVGLQGQIGLNGELPWHDQGDLQWFRQMTMGGAVVVGHVTYQGLPKLPGRLVIKDSRELDLAELGRLTSGLPVWIAGGAKTYMKWLPYVTRMYISRIPYSGPADAWMPNLWNYAHPQLDSQINPTSRPGGQV